MTFVTSEQAQKMYCVKNDGGLCAGNYCMAWRWKPKQTRFVEEGTQVPDNWIVFVDEWGDKNIDISSDKKKYIEYEKVETERTGYCGIGGYISTDY